MTFGKKHEKGKRRGKCKIKNKKVERKRKKGGRKRENGN
jgi:hypothetical protein